MIKKQKVNKNAIQKSVRRQNGEGSIFKRADGRWTASMYINKQENGVTVRKRKVVYGRTKTEVTSKLNKISGRINNISSEIDDKTVGELMFEWLMVFKKSAITPRSFEGDIRNFKVHIEPIIGNMKLDEVNTIAIQQLINEMVDKEYAVATIKKVKHLIGQFFEYAISNNWVLQNPTLKIRLRSKDKISTKGSQYKALTPEIRMKFILALGKEPKNYIKPLCSVLMFSGLRIAEALALQWSDVNFEHKKLKIKQAITTIPKFDENGQIKERITVIGKTKTACSVREVPLVDFVINALKDWRKNQIDRQQNDREITGDITSQDAYIFANDDGTIKTYSGTRNTFRRFLRRHNLKAFQIHFHGLRHTFSNMLFEMNENPKVIQQLLGHRDVKTTIMVYNSVNSDYIKESTDKFNEKINDDLLCFEEAERQEIIKQKQEALISSLNNNEFDDMLLRLLEERKKRNSE